MFKLIGAVIVLLSSTLFGMSKYSRIFERQRCLYEIRDGSMRMENIIRCMNSPLHEAFLSGGSFFEDSAEKIKGGILPSEAVWETAQKMPLTKHDLSIIRRFSEGLCAEDSKGQIENMKLFIKELDGAIASSVRELETRGKLYVKGSILVGAAFVLMII